MTFKVGDIVRFGENVGVVSSTGHCVHYPIEVKFDINYETFTEDGRHGCGQLISLYKVEESAEVVDTTSTKPFEFQVGDKVRVKPGLGARNEISSIRSIEAGIPRGISVFNYSGWQWFSKYELEFIERPKKKVKKTGWINVYYNQTCLSVGSIWDTFEKALNSSPGGIYKAIDTVKIEVEVDEE